MAVYALSTEELKGLQVVLLDMLLELDRICKKNNIKYCLFGGTMLGAYRHKGFIPWDDDLDVAMLRTDYNKFRTACERDLDAKKFFFQDHTTDPYYRWGYGRIRRKGSEFVRVNQEHMKMHTGIFLDIFPMDGVPEFAPFRGFHNFYCYLLRKLLYAEVGIKTGKRLYNRMGYALMNCIPHAWTFRRLDKLALKWKDTKWVRHTCFPMPKGRPYGFLRTWCEDLVDINFEGFMFPGIKDAHDYLANHYGSDYMQPPPPEKRHWHPVSRFKLPD